MASRVALDLPYWAMRLVLYHLIRMAIEMAREGGVFFCVDFMSCITIAKRPWYGQLKIKPSTMNAGLAIIADGGQAIIVIDREGVEIN